MAQLDRIILKHSQVEELEDFKNAIRASDIEGGSIEAGELVIRRGEQFAELWTLDTNGDITQISTDIGGIAIPWDKEELLSCDLSDIGDVDIEDGIAGELDTGEAGWLLTWDGTKWVVRPPAAYGGNAGLIPSLNDAGDVNYGFYASANNPKYTPDANDLLWYQYDYPNNKYYWAPVAPTFDIIDGTVQAGNVVTFNRAKISELRFAYNSQDISTSQRIIAGSGLTLMADEDMEINLKKTYLGQNAYQKNIFIKSPDDIYIENATKIRYTSNTIPNLHDGTDESLFSLTTLEHVRTEFGNQQLQNIGDVSDIIPGEGYVLAWNSAASEWQPVAGPAPDLSSAGINDLRDVNTNDRDYGKTLVWNPSEGNWKAQYPELWYAKFDYYQNFGATPEAFPDLSCQPCDEENLGRYTVVDNLPYVCLKVRESTDKIENEKFAYVRILMDGLNNAQAFIPPAENAQEKPLGVTDPLHLVAYEGSLGALENVSTADASPGLALIAETGGFRMGFPLLNLNDYSIGQLGDVAPYGAGTGYGLLWDGTNWVASTLDQRFRLDDMQDVQFGDLGITNNKLVAAYMLVANPNLNYLTSEDVSTVLAVSTPKANANVGTTYEFFSPENYLYPIARYWGPSSNWTLQQRLDNYVSWANDVSWQVVDGDGCIEIFFYPSLLLEDRCIFRKVATQGNGGYTLRLLQDGSLSWNVVGAQGQSGFQLSTPNNSVSLNNWHHVAVTKEADLHALWLDGYRVDYTTADVIYTGDQEFILGRNDLNDQNVLTHNFWRGFMLDLRVTRGRAKYTGTTYTVPYGIGREILDTTPNAGDFLSYDGTKWTNVAGVDADISTNSIDELLDVDVTSNNPGTGDALVWTGNKWEPGIPGVGSTWGLDDFSDVSTFYQVGSGYVRFDQATTLYFSDLYKNIFDQGSISSPGYATSINQFDGSWTCSDEWNTFGLGDGTSPSDDDAKFWTNQSTFVRVGLQGNVEIKGEKITVLNRFSDCYFIPRTFHGPSLHYQGCPNRAPSSTNLHNGDFEGGVIPETYIPCWGVLEDEINKLLAFGSLGSIGNVDAASPAIGQALAWDGTSWKPSSTISADISNNGIGDLRDVSPNASDNTVIEGYALLWNGSVWAPAPIAQDMFLFDTVEEKTVTNTFPIPGPRLYDTRDQEITTNQQEHENVIIGFAGKGERGFEFTAYEPTQNGFNPRKAYMFGGVGVGSPTFITSGLIGSTGSFLEIAAGHVRVADNGALNNGIDGFRIAKDWKIVYEDVDLVWDDFTNAQVPNKESILEYLNVQFNDLDITQYPLEDLENVNTAGKAIGYALMWDGSQWIASNSVAANIGSSSIGGLVDIDKTDNSDAVTNDGDITFDIGQLKTSRPAQTGGGLDLPSSNAAGLIGWSSNQEGAPYLKNTTGPLDTSSIEVLGDEVGVHAANGIIYGRQPSLGDNTVPSWLQVRQQIIRSAVDYQALFLLKAENFLESSYNWPLQVSVVTSPNPVYDSKFSGSYSIHFRKFNQDKIEWTANDGCPETWAAGRIWSFEFLIKTDSQTTGDGRDEYIIAPAEPDSYQSTGLHIYLKGLDRSELGVYFGTRILTNYGADHISGSLIEDSWNHVYLAQEGGGLIRLYINGIEVGDHLQTGAWQLTGGMAIGGRTLPDAFDEQGYLTAQLDDLRITDGWLPYITAAGSVPVPVDPLPLGDVANVFGRLSMLEDVNTTATAPVHGDALIWNAVQGYWEPGAEPAADISASSIGELTDVNVANSVADNGDVLAWDSSASEFQRTKIDGNGGVRPLVARTVAPGFVPSAGSLFAGELFLNMADKKLYALDASGTAFNFATDGTYSDVTEIDGGLY